MFQLMQMSPSSGERRDLLANFAQAGFLSLNLTGEVSCSCEKTVWPLSAHKMQHADEGSLVLPEGKGNEGLLSVWECVVKVVFLPNLLNPHVGQSLG